MIFELIALDATIDRLPSDGSNAAIMKKTSSGGDYQLDDGFIS
jgi:hypothetical protein